MKNISLIFSLLLFFACTSPKELEFSVSPESELISIGEPILFHFNLTYNGDSSLVIPDPFLYPNEMKVKFGKNEHLVKRNPYCIRNQSPTTIALEKGDSHTKSIDLQDHYYFTEGGEVEFIFTYFSENGEILQENKTRIQIKQPSTLELEAQSDYFDLIDSDEDWSVLAQKGKAFLKKHPENAHCIEVMKFTANSFINIKAFDQAIEMYQQLIAHKAVPKLQQNKYQHEIADIYFHFLKDKEKALKTLATIDDEKAKKEIKYWSKRLGDN